MRDELDSDLQSLFEQQQPIPGSNDFTARVMARVDRRQMGFRALQLGILILLVGLELVFESPISQSMGALNSAMKSSVLELEDEWISFVLEPVNSVAGVLGMVLLGVHFLMRRVLR